MARGPIKLGVGIVAAAGAMVFLGWRLLEFITAVWGPDDDSFVPPPASGTPRPAVQITEVTPPTGAVTLRNVSSAAGPGDVPGWRVRVNAAPAAARDPTPPWRGADGPTWRQSLGGRGTASPIVVGARIYVTIADAGPTLWLECLNLTDGSHVWRQAVSRAPFPPRHAKTSDAASTPCSDGERVFVAHAGGDAVHLTAYTLDGARLWTTPLGPFSARWGFSSSPAWARGLVVVGADNAEDGFVAAVDGTSGRGVWRRRRPRAADASYSSPVLVVESTADAADGSGDAATAEPQVVLAGLERIESHALATGRTLWSIGGISSTSGATPVVAGDVCVAMSGFPVRAMMALRMPPAGGMPAVLWKEDRDSEIPYVPSPMVHDGRLYVVHDDGLAHCRDLATGRVVWKQRVGGAFSASPELVSGELLCADESGRCTLLGLADGKVRHTFALSGGCFATPVVSRGRLLIRTSEELVAFDVAGPPAATE